MHQLLDSLQSLVGGVFALLGGGLALIGSITVAWINARSRRRDDTTKHDRERAQRHYEEIKDLYANTIAAGERFFRKINARDRHVADPEVPLLNAKLRLSTTDGIWKQYNLYVDTVDQYAEAVRPDRSKSHEAGNKGKQATQSSYSPACAQQFDRAIEAMDSLARMMRAHMESLRP